MFFKEQFQLPNTEMKQKYQYIRPTCDPILGLLEKGPPKFFWRLIPRGLYKSFGQPQRFMPSVADKVVRPLFSFKSNEKVIIQLAVYTGTEVLGGRKNDSEFPAL